jgi:long-subunit acyl-CoA synthetase (AMP-forming)
MFTTASSETADYVMNFTEMKVLFVGETEIWDQVWVNHSCANHHLKEETQ